MYSRVYPFEITCSTRKLTNPIPITYRGHAHLEQLLLLDEGVPHGLPADGVERPHQRLQPPPIPRQLHQGVGGHGRVVHRRVLRRGAGQALHR